MLTIVCILFALLFMSSPTHAATYQVHQQGSDSTPCGQGPRRTLAAGASCLAPGDTLLVGSGTYHECLTAAMIPGGSSAASPTIVRNAPGAAVWLFAVQPCPANAESGGVINLERGGDYHVVIDGINVDANNTNNIGFGLVTSAVLVQNLTVKNTPRQCFQIFAPHNTIRNVTVENCGTNPATAAGAHGFYVGTTHTLLDGVTIRNVNCNGLQFSLEKGGVRDNTIQNSCVSGAGCTGIVLHGGNSAINNVVSHSGMGIDAWGAKVIGNTVHSNKILGISLKGSGHEVRDNKVGRHTGTDIGDGGGYTGGSTFSNNGCQSRTGDNLGCTYVLDQLPEAACTGGSAGPLPTGPAPLPPTPLPAPKNLRSLAVP